MTCCSRICAVVAAATLAFALAPRAQEPSKSDATEFRRSDPALLSATGRPQLVEFFHPR